MIRQDKITFLVSTLGNLELYGHFKYNQNVHDKSFNVPDYANRIFKRIGIISKFENNSSDILTQYLPVNKHGFLNKALLEFSNDYCLDNNPFCENCHLDVCCDYYNKKNDWSE